MFNKYVNLVEDTLNEATNLTIEVMALALDELDDKETKNFMALIKKLKPKSDTSKESILYTFKNDSDYKQVSDFLGKTKLKSGSDYNL